MVGKQCLLQIEEVINVWECVSISMELLIYQRIHIIQRKYILQKQSDRYRGIHQKFSPLINTLKLVMRLTLVLMIVYMMYIIQILDHQRLILLKIYSFMNTVLLKNVKFNLGNMKDIDIQRLLALDQDFSAITWIVITAKLMSLTLVQLYLDIKMRHKINQLLFMRKQRLDA